MLIADRPSAMPVVASTPRLARSASATSDRASEASTPRSQSPVSRSSSFTRLASTFIQSGTLSRDDKDAALDRTAFGQTLKFLSAQQVLENTIAPKGSQIIPPPPAPASQIFNQHAVAATAASATNFFAVTDRDTESDCHADADHDIGNCNHGPDEQLGSKNRPTCTTSIYQSSEKSRVGSNGHVHQHPLLKNGNSSFSSPPCNDDQITSPRSATFHAGTSATRHVVKSPEVQMLMDAYGMSESDAKRELLRRSRTAHGEHSSPNDMDTVDFASPTRSTLPRLDRFNPAKSAPLLVSRYQHSTSQAKVDPLAATGAASSPPAFMASLPLRTTACPNTTMPSPTHNGSIPSTTAKDETASAEDMFVSPPTSLHDSPNHVAVESSMPSTSDDLPSVMSPTGHQSGLPKTLTGLIPISASFPVTSFPSSSVSASSHRTSSPPRQSATPDSNDSTEIFTPLKFLRPDAGSYVVAQSSEPLPPSPTTSASLPPMVVPGVDGKAMEPVSYGLGPSSNSGTEFGQGGNIVAAAESAKPPDTPGPAGSKSTSSQPLSVLRRSLARATAASSRLGLGRKRRAMKSDIIENSPAVSQPLREDPSSDVLASPVDEPSRVCAHTPAGLSAHAPAGLSAHSDRAARLVRNAREFEGIEGEREEDAISAVSDKPIVIRGPSRPLMAGPLTSAAIVSGTEMPGSGTPSSVSDRKQPQDKRIIRAPSNPYRTMSSGNHPPSVKPTDNPSLLNVTNHQGHEPQKLNTSTDISCRSGNEAYNSVGTSHAPPNTGLSLDPKQSAGLSESPSPLPARNDFDNNENVTPHRHSCDPSAIRDINTSDDVPTCSDGKDKNIDEPIPEAVGGASQGLEKTPLIEMQLRQTEPKETVATTRVSANASANISESKTNGPMPEQVRTVIIKRVIRRTKADGSEEIVTERVRVRPVKIFPNGDVVVRRTVMQPKNDGSGDFESVIMYRTIRKKRSEGSHEAQNVFAKAGAVQDDNDQGNNIDIQKDIGLVSSLTKGDICNQAQVHAVGSSSIPLEAIDDSAARRFPDKPETRLGYSSPFLTSGARSVGSSASPGTYVDNSPSSSSGPVRSMSFGEYEPIVHGNDAPVHFPAHIAQRLFTDKTPVDMAQFTSVKSDFANIAPVEGFFNGSDSWHGSLPRQDGSLSMSNVHAETDITPITGSSSLKELGSPGRSVPRNKTLINLLKGKKSADRGGAATAEAENLDSARLDALHSTIPRSGSTPAENGNGGLSNDNTTSVGREDTPTEPNAQDEVAGGRDLRGRRTILKSLITRARRQTIPTTS